MARILVVDDDPDLGALLQVKLEQAGHEVVVGAKTEWGSIGRAAERRGCEGPQPLASPSVADDPLNDIVLRLTGVGVQRAGVALLDRVDWTVRSGERWVVLGPNGSGKTTLLRLASLHLHPSTGTVEVLGQLLGRVDVRRLRTRIGLASPSFADLLRPGITAAEIVMTEREAALEPWWHAYGEEDRQAAVRLLARTGTAELADRTFGTLSSGERQRVMLARSLWGDPGLVLLDEPTAGLDLGAREDLVARLARLADDPAAPPTVLVTHHVEEIPPGFTHGLLLRAGRVLAAGRLDAVLTADALSEAFGLALALDRRHDRYSARAVTG